MSKNKNFKYMRDCVKKMFHSGCRKGYEFRKMRHALVMEFKRLGYITSEIKDKLLQWNERCEKPYNFSEQRIQLLKYVEWVESNECRLGCKALEDFCIKKEKYQFEQRRTYKNRQQTKELPFNLEELDKFLIERYRGDGYVMMLIVKALRMIQVEKATGEVILVGYRALSSYIRDRLGHRLGEMLLFRRMQLLMEEGITEVVVKGKSGEFRGQANGYKFLPWKPPTHINPYV